MGLIVAHINRGVVKLEADARALADHVLKPKWDARDREAANKMFSKIKPGEILVDMTSKQGA